ncbi:hypothetical protein E3N88_22943 [Mikania micrantha]|uniref:Uncharacterized protein n=1 Tax=Mikania micrantha TaxID=192012 RepID=A0A5N6NBX2_9ASTR|nr:hypothetical protein E3N88_22943 [Mikania micrantha]
MLKHKGLSNDFWGEAVSCAAYLLNRSYTKSVPNITPQEAWSGFKPSVNHLRVFGSLAFVHIPDQKRSKLEDKSARCIFIGYSEQSKAYKLFNPQTQKVIISRDVKIDEERRWTEETHDEATTTPLRDNEESIEESELQEDNNSEASNIDNNNEPVASSSSTTQPSQRRTRTLQDLYDNTQRLDPIDYADFCLYAGADPIDFEEACKEKKWQDAMDCEIQSILKNDTWELVDAPQNQKTIGVKWIYKTKLNEKGQVDKYKARLVVKGYKQKYGIDYQEVFAPVIRLETIRLILSIAAQHNWHVHQMDVKSAFLNGHLQEDVYIEQPMGYIQKGQENKVCKLKRALYGLKQAPRAWYSRIDEYFQRKGFKKCTHEHTLFIKKLENHILIVCLYVDDLVISCSSIVSIQAFKEDMKKEFEMTDLGVLHYFLRIEVKQGRNMISISQQKYAKDLLIRFDMFNAATSTTPMEHGLKLTKSEIEDDL